MVRHGSWGNAYGGRDAVMVVMLRQPLAALGQAVVIERRGRAAGSSNHNAKNPSQQFVNLFAFEHVVVVT